MGLHDLMMAELVRDSYNSVFGRGIEKDVDTGMYNKVLVMPVTTTSLHRRIELAKRLWLRRLIWHSMKVSRKFTRNGSRLSRKCRNTTRVALLLWLTRSKEQPICF